MEFQKSKYAHLILQQSGRFFFILLIITITPYTILALEARC